MKNLHKYLIGIQIGVCLIYLLKEEFDIFPFLIFTLLLIFAIIDLKE